MGFQMGAVWPFGPRLNKRLTCQRIVSKLLSCRATEVHSVNREDSLNTKLVGFRLKE